ACGCAYQLAKPCRQGYLTTGSESLGSPFSTASDRLRCCTYSYLMDQTGLAQAQAGEQYMVTGPGSWMTLAMKLAQLSWATCGSRAQAQPRATGTGLTLPVRRLRMD